MKETVEFRIPEHRVSRYLPQAARCGRSLASGFVRKLMLRPNDPLILDIKRIDEELRAAGEGVLFTYARVHRAYSALELGEAPLLHASLKRTFEPSGEECGTVYDDARGFPDCGAGAPQSTPLFLNSRHIPRKADFARTIAGEIIASDRVVETCSNERLSGAEFDPVLLADKGGTASKAHFQVRVLGPAVELHPLTRAGGNIFDESSYGQCPGGHVAGLSLLSEVTVKADTVAGADIMATRQMIGARQGLLRPEPILLLSPRAWRVFERAKLNGLAIEVAHLS